jgi:hypothetical protein
VYDIIGVVPNLCVFNSIAIELVNVKECYISTKMNIIITFHYIGTVLSFINPLRPELNPSAQRCLTRFLLGI